MADYSMIKKPTGTINLTKGNTQAISATTMLTVTMSWENLKRFGRALKELDYDLMCHVVYQNGSTEDVDFSNLTSRDGSVKHLGDIKGGGSKEVITFTPSTNSQVQWLGFSCYSAFDNGTGSFNDAKIKLTVDNGEGSVVQVDGLGTDHRRYTLYFATVDCRQPPNASIEAVEDYSERESENRPVLDRSGRHYMDAGIAKTSK